MKNIILSALFFLGLTNLFGQPPGFTYTAQACAGTTSLAMVGTVQINGVAPGNGSWIAAFDATNVLAGSSALFLSGMTSYIAANQVNTDEDTPAGPPNNCEVVDAGIDGWPGSPEQFFIVVWNATDGKYYQFPDHTMRTYFNYVPDGGLGIFVSAFANFTTNWNFTGLGYDNLPDLFNLVLPVELVNFEGKLNGKVVQLDWSTSSETNNSHFEIEHSADGRSFDYIGQVKGAGDSQTLLQYTFTDESPNYGLNYYRLKQVDFDGQFEYSKVVSVSLDRKGGSDVEVFPNPAGTFAELLLPEDLSDVETTITVHDNAGREVLRRKEQPNVLVRLPLDGIPAGFYTLTVRGGNEVISKPLVVQ